MKPALLWLLLLVACNRSSLPGDREGGTAACPPSEPPFSEQHCSYYPTRGPICNYGPIRCRTCAEGWQCLDARCPLDEDPTGPCADVGLNCGYFFEHHCSCTRNGWKCCGGVPDQCPLGRPVEGSVCGCQVGQSGRNPAGGCYYGRCPDSVQCACVDNGWVCSQLACVDAAPLDL